MHMLVLSESLSDIVKELKNISLPSHSTLSEEEQYPVPSFTETGEFYEFLEIPKDGLNIINVKFKDEIKFEAFLDGVQRTVMCRRIPLSTGALVPIHIAHICAGVILRDNKGNLYLEPDLTAARLLLLGPFKGLMEKGIRLESLNNEEIIWDTDDKTFAFPDNLNECIVCDTTFRGTSKDRENYFEGALIGDALFNEGLVRSRAQGRVATLRQRLEMAVLAQFRKKYPEKWILVDGPLFFIDKWRRPAFRVLGQKLKVDRESDLENELLKNAVGIIKTHRLRPKNLEQIIQIGPSQRSVVMKLFREVDIKGCRDNPDEDGNYGGIHLCWYTRLRSSPNPPYGLLGLVRIDIHRSTLGVVLGDALNPENFEFYSSRIDDITLAVWRERWPVIPLGNDYRSAAEPYPIYQLEQILKASTLPRRFLAYLTS